MIIRCIKLDVKIMLDDDGSVVVNMGSIYSALPSEMIRELTNMVCDYVYEHKDEFRDRTAQPRTDMVHTRRG